MPLSLSNHTQVRVHRLLAFYAHHELARFDEWLTNWAGREDELLRALRDYYGPEPPIAWLPRLQPGHESSEKEDDVTLAAQCRWSLSNVLCFYQPSLLRRIEEILFAWREQLPLLALRLRTLTEARDSVMRWFEQHCPDRFEEGCALAREYAGQEGWLLAYLDGALAVEGDAFAMPPARSRTTIVNPLPEMSTAEVQTVWRQRLVELYRQVQPESIGHVDLILQCFQGREAELFGHLHGTMAERRRQPVSSSSSESLTPVLPPTSESAELLPNDFVVALVALHASGALKEYPKWRRWLRDWLGRVCGPQRYYRELRTCLSSDTYLSQFFPSL